MNPNTDNIESIDRSEAGFTPWPKPLSAQALSTVKKILLLVVVLVGAYQIVPAGSFGAAVSQTFTLLVILSWLAPAGRILMQLSMSRRGPQQEEPPAS